MNKTEEKRFMAKLRINCWRKNKKRKNSDCEESDEEVKTSQDNKKVPVCDEVIVQENTSELCEVKCISGNFLQNFGEDFFKEKNCRFF